MDESITEQRAGGLVFRSNAREIEYLLVTSISHPERWIIPAGHIEEGESPEMAALREVAEEAGVKANIVADLDCYQYHWFRNNQKIILNTHLYLMKYQETIDPKPEGRLVRFFSYETLIALNLWQESKELIRKAHQRYGKVGE